ncbi:ectonucleoside triphosphate diphosphohydrolase 6 isoform X3 [Gadus chalcogrammus]|uniref:ectonucleoside triphosphate diphosphohydrolase 6 isoform X3 n=1 Tax=Gadus chalcogrammus TaxID=1042646 RepID=UPI0024C497E9|nr:ectonucleoside triphosphate diphosphohydrolase 6 isoform X3 [Gadus chalcogrammus]
MRIPRLASVFLSVAGLLAYLMYVKQHYARPAAAQYRPPGYTLLRGPAGDPGPATDEPAKWHFRYGVMIDAGSTGTRIHVFKFLHQLNEVPKLAHETFKAIKPGLSAYADDPDQCTAGLLQLFEVAKASIPAAFWSRTPLVLKATAGLRLLPGEKATQLLNKVRAVFSESPFLSSSDAVSIMDGTDEGISAWITVNFLTGGLGAADSPTVGMLDLGGGSTQITFNPQDETIQTSPIDFISSIQMFNTSYTLYSHSYLGLGLLSARLAVLGGVEGQDAPAGSVELVSPCLAPEQSCPWQHGEVVYTVRGQKEGEPVYDACRTKVEKVLYRRVQPAPETRDLDFYAFSFYYDLAVDLQLIEAEKGGTVKVSDYSNAAKRVCERPSDQSPFLCLDLTYVSVLLQELGFPPDKELKLARTIGEVETSWPLGAVFHYMEANRR